MDRIDRVVTRTMMQYHNFIYFPQHISRSVGVHWHQCPAPATGPRGTWRVCLEPRSAANRPTEITEFLRRCNAAIEGISVAKKYVYQSWLSHTLSYHQYHQYYQYHQYHQHHRYIIGISYSYYIHVYTYMLCFKIDEAYLSLFHSHGHLQLAPVILRPKATIFVDHRVLTCAVRQQI